MIGDLPHTRCHADDDKLAQIPIAHLRDLSQPLLATAGMVARCQTKPRRKFPPTLELVTRPDCRGHGRGGHRSYAGNGLQELGLAADEPEYAS